MACDRLAISTMGPDEPPEYGRTIVSLLESFSQARYLPLVAGILEDTCQMERRIKMIADYTKTPRPRWAGAMLLIVTLAGIVLTNAYIAKADYTFSTVTNLGPVVNSSSNDGLPCISADGLELYFGSDRTMEKFKFDIWICRRTDISSNWGAPENLGPPVNGPYSDHWPEISADGLELYFYSLDRPGGYGSGDIWLTTRSTTDDPWGEPMNLGPVINSSEDEGAPAISTDGLELYFASGKSGVLDLYVSKRSNKNDDWGEPVSLDILNSPDGESGPSLSSDELTLFFQSDRPSGFGGIDLYITTRATRDDNWSQPLNLGPQVNTQYSEVSPCISHDGHTLYFCDLPYSDVPPGSMGGGDIWQVSILPIVDFNSDGNINTDDLLILIDNWGQNEPLCDIGPMPFGDGIVDIKDLEVFMSYWEKENMPEAPEEEQ
jgi:hypothetical protein